MAIPYMAGEGSIRYRKATGAGTVQSPDVVEYFDTNSALLLAAAVAIQAAVETLQDVVAGTEAQVDVVSIALPSVPVNGQKTVTAAGTAEALGATLALTSGLTVKALVGNAGIVYVGDVDVDASNGFEMEAGDTVFVEVDDVASVYVDSAQNGDGVSYVGS